VDKVEAATFRGIKRMGNKGKTTIRGRRKEYKKGLEI
jgi:hypothetical protein